jgi:hypothetical protein
MTSLDLIGREIRALLFDQYGTVVDLQTGLTETVTPSSPRRGGRAARTSSSPGGGGRISRTR